MKILHLLLLVITVMSHWAVYAEQVDPCIAINSIEPTWCEIQATSDPNSSLPPLPDLIYMNTWDENCSPKVGILMLHGSVKPSAGPLGGATSIANSSYEDGAMHIMMDWFKQQCFLVVAPNARIRYGIRRWDTDNSFHDLEKLINLMDTIVNAIGIEQLYVMGGSSGAIMTHNIALNVLNRQVDFEHYDKLKGIVIADGVSANMVHYVDMPSILATLTNSQINHLVKLTFTECDKKKYFSYKGKNHLISPTIDTLRLGAYLDESGFMSENLNRNDIFSGIVEDWTLPSLVIFTDDDATIPVCLKEEFADALSSKAETTLDKPSVVKQCVTGNHSGDVWRNGCRYIIDGLKSVSNLINSDIEDNCPDPQLQNLTCDYLDPS